MQVCYSLWSYWCKKPKEDPSPGTPYFSPQSVHLASVAASAAVSDINTMAVTASKLTGLHHMPA